MRVGSGKAVARQSLICVDRHAWRAPMSNVVSAIGNGSARHGCMQNEWFKFSYLHGILLRRAVHSPGFKHSSPNAHLQPVAGAGVDGLRRTCSQVMRPAIAQTTPPDAIVHGTPTVCDRNPDSRPPMGIIP